MRLDAGQLAQAVRLSFRDPRGVARGLIRLGLPPATGALALALMAVLSALLSSLALRLAPTTDPELEAIFASPLGLMVLQGGVLLVTAMLIHGVGRMFGGAGRFADAVVLMAWIEALLLLLQLFQIAVLLLVPPLADAIGLIAIVAFLWLLANFVAELHGFASAGAVALGIFATVVTISLALAVIAVAFLGFGA